MIAARQTARRIRISTAILVAYLVGVAMLVTAFAAQGAALLSAYGRWIIAVPVGLIAYVGFELFAAWALRQPVIQRVPASARVPLLACVFLCCLVVVGILVDARIVTTVGA